MLGAALLEEKAHEGLNPLLYELLLLLWQEIQQQKERQLCVGRPHAISERQDAERLPFLSRWAQPGASLTSQGGLANGMHSQEASPGAAQELRQQQQQQEASPGVAQRPQQRQQQQAHHPRQAGRRNYSDRHTSSLCQVWSSSCSRPWSSSSQPWSNSSRPRRSSSSRPWRSRSRP